MDSDLLKIHYYLDPDNRSPRCSKSAAWRTVCCTAGSAQGKKGYGRIYSKEGRVRVGSAQGRGALEQDMPPPPLF